jgi:hypothetical protein
VVIEAVYVGPAEGGREMLRPLRELGPELDTFTQVPPAVLGQLHMDPEDPVPGAGSGQLLDDLPPAAIEKIVEVAGPGSGSPLLSFELRLLGGALTEAPPAVGALARIDQRFLSAGVGMIMDPAMASLIKAALQTLEDALEPWDSGVKFANFIDVPIDTRTCYPPETFERLQDVKARYDGEDLFRANQAIPCPAAAG